MQKQTHLFYLLMMVDMAMSHSRAYDLEAPESAKNSIITPSTNMGYLGILLNASLLYIIKLLSEL